jgi:hypothetical protein
VVRGEVIYIYPIRRHINLENCVHSSRERYGYCKHFINTNVRLQSKLVRQYDAKTQIFAIKLGINIHMIDQLLVSLAKRCNLIAWFTVYLFLPLICMFLAGFFCIVLFCAVSNTLSKSVLKMHWFYADVLKILEWKYVGKINHAKWTVLDCTIHYNGWLEIKSTPFNQARHRCFLLPRSQIKYPSSSIVSTITYDSWSTAVITAE